MRSLLILAAFCAATFLSGCNMFPVGPDLAKSPSPFGEIPSVVLSDDEGRVFAEIRHTQDGDTATLHFPDIERKSYFADVTWHALSNDDDKAHDYWLAAANVFKTKDRSAYVILRLPHSKDFHSTGDMLSLACEMRVDEATNAELMDPKHEAPIHPMDSDQHYVKPDNAKLDSCDFKDLDEVYGFIDELMVKARQEELSSAGKPDDEKSTTYQWQKVTIRIP